MVEIHRNIVFVILISLNSICANSQNIYNVINVKGAEIFSQPNLNSKVVTKLENGSKVLIHSKISTSQTKGINQEILLEGEFLEFHFFGEIGYIFSSDVTQLNTEIKKYGWFTKSKLYGKLIEQETTTKEVTYGNKTYEIDETKYEFENLTYIYSSFDGCFDHTYIFKNLKLNEVYHFFGNEYVFFGERIDGEFIEIPTLHQRNENTFQFEFEAGSGEMIIKNNEFVIKSYDCA